MSIRKKQLELESELQSLQKANLNLENLLEATKVCKRQEVSQLNKMHAETLKVGVWSFCLNGTICFINRNYFQTQMAEHLSILIDPSGRSDKTFGIEFYFVINFRQCLLASELFPFPPRLFFLFSFFSSFFSLRQGLMIAKAVLKLTR